MSGPLFLGVDIGTSGVRSAVVTAEGGLVSQARAAHPAAAPRNDQGVDAEAWWTAVAVCLTAQMAAMKPADGARICAIAVCGTSGSMVLTDAQARPVTPGLMYDSAGFDAEADAIAAHAPPGAITRGSNSALARMLRLQRLDPEGRATALCHQADFAVARLRGAPGYSDDTNALKTGFDPLTGQWPVWTGAAGLRTELFPKVHRVGALLGRIAPAMAQKFGLPDDLELIAGTTDSVAAFLAAGAAEPGDAVTSLGTTLAVKLLSPARIDDAGRGIYSHRIGEAWLAGGASNTGGGVLASLFSDEEIARLSEGIDPARPTGLDYYPLRSPGERFPVNDPALAPRMTPRPESDATFLQGLFEAMARIEAEGYAALADLGGPTPRRILTAGGGARNAVWTEIRQRAMNRAFPGGAAPSVGSAEDAEASVGMARLARDAMARRTVQRA